jgi:hypothetical protein
MDNFAEVYFAASGRTDLNVAVMFNRLPAGEGKEERVICAVRSFLLVAEKFRIWNSKDGG